MTTSTRQSCVVSSSSRSLLKEDSSGARGISCGTRMASPFTSGGDSYYDGYDSDRSHLNLALSVKSNDRESRKKAEKQRRTVLNTYIGQLAGLIPLVAESTKKIDKTSILRLAAHDLRKDHVFGDSIKPCHADVGPAAVDAFLELLGGFLLTTTVKGVVVVVSSNVFSHLGHLQIDLLGQNIINFTHPEDVESVKENLTPGPAGAAGRRDFLARLARAGGRAESAQYALCRLDGSFRRSDHAGLGSGLRPIRRQRVRKDRAISPSGNDYVFVGVVRVLDHTAVPDRLLEANKQEYWTRHLVDGRIVHCDQRISLVAGYMSEEVTGVSAFTFMHREDVRWVVIALRQMYDENEPYGESCYRLVSRTGQFMYLRTKGFLEIDRSTKVAQSFVCINSLVSEEDGTRMISDMKKKYSAIIDLEDSDDSFQHSSDGDDPGVEDPRQLEQVIMHLITNLPSPGPGAGPGPLVRRPSLSPGGPPCPAARRARALEPLTIIPPTVSTVKSSIVKSISVMSLSGALKRATPEKGGERAERKRLCRDRLQHSSVSDEDYG